MKKILGILSLATVLAVASVAFAADGATLYKSCGGCHGADGSKPAGGSAPLKGQKVEEVVKKMQGYADGSYGGAQKKVMENIAKKQTAEDIQALADFISKL